MPSLRFANLGSTPGTPEVSVSGNLYFFTTDDSPIGIVFDLRKYEINPPSDEYAMKFTRVESSSGSPFEIAVLPKSRLRPIDEISEGPRPFSKTLDKVYDVYVVNLSNQEPTTIGWRFLEWLFPKKRISKIPLGRDDWRLATEEERERRAIQGIESTGLVERGQKVEVGPFTLYFFRSTQLNGLPSVLVTGETKELPFVFFFGSQSFQEFFFSDQVDASSARLRVLRPGRWNAFYPVFEPLPVKVSHGQT